MKNDETLKKFDEASKCFNIKRDEFQLQIENGEKDYQEINKKELDKFLDKKR